MVLPRHRRTAGDSFVPAGVHLFLVIEAARKPWVGPCVALLLRAVFSLISHVLNIVRVAFLSQPCHFTSPPGFMASVQSTVKPTVSSTHRRSAPHSMSAARPGARRWRAVLGRGGGEGAGLSEGLPHDSRCARFTCLPGELMVSSLGHGALIPAGPVGANRVQQPSVCNKDQRDGQRSN